MSWLRAAEARTRVVRAGVGATAAAALAVMAGLSASGCYSFSGGGGLPSHIRTAYVVPVENETSRFGLSEVLTQELLDAARERLGLRLAAEGNADALIRAVVRQYSDDAVNFEAREGVGADVFQRRVTIGAAVQIYDTVNDQVVWESAAVTGTGEYDPEAGTEDEGQTLAMANLVQKIMDGAQSQW